MKKLLIVCFCFLISCIDKSEESKTNASFRAAITVEKSEEVKQFWAHLKKLCGKSFEGVLELPEDDKDFGGKKLVMHVRSCDENVIRIPFFVGDDKSRTWVLTLDNDRIQLKHDHRHEDGTDDQITMYGGTTTNSGQATIQTFPADQETKKMIPAASTNIWWITVDNSSFTYNLRRLGTDRVFRVSFDLSKPIENPEAPWGWKD